MVRVGTDQLPDPVHIAVAGRVDLRDDVAARAKVLGALNEAAALRPERFTPIYLGGGLAAAEPFDMSRLESAVVSSRQTVSVALESPDFHWRFGFTPASTGVGSTVTLQAPAERFSQFDQYLGPLRAICVAIEPLFGVGHSSAELELRREKLLEDPFTKPHLNEVYWINVYGSKFVNRVGRERFLAVPAFRIEELADGSVLLMTTAKPLPPTDSRSLEARAKVRAHLCDGVEVGSELARVQQRLDQLAPVECDWDPLLEDVLLKVVRSEGVLGGLRRARKLKSFRPSAVKEQRPLDQLKETDVENVEGVVGEYGERAESISAHIHREYRELKRLPPIVSLVAQRSVDSLPELDAHLWQEDYAKHAGQAFRNDTLVPGLGAYLGELIVRQLGGRWIPRKKLVESQVVAGDRVWLPFLRAERCTRSKKAALQYSLTYFYRTVEQACH